MCVCVRILEKFFFFFFYIKSSKLRPPSTHIVRLIWWESSAHRYKLVYNIIMINKRILEICSYIVRLKFKITSSGYPYSWIRQATSLRTGPHYNDPYLPQIVKNFRHSKDSMFRRGKPPHRRLRIVYVNFWPIVKKSRVTLTRIYITAKHLQNKYD